MANQDVIRQLEREYMWVRTMQEARKELGLEPLDPTRLRRFANEVRELKGSEFSREAYDAVVQQMLIYGETIKSDKSLQAVFAPDHLQQLWSNALIEFRKQGTEITGADGQVINTTTIPVTAINEELGRFLNDGNKDISVFYVNRDDMLQYMDAYANNGEYRNYTPRATVNLKNEYNRPTREQSVNGFVKIARPDIPAENEIYTVYGWYGKKTEMGDELLGLKSMMTSLLSKEDAEVMAEIFKDREIRSDRAQYIVDMLTQLRVEGYAVSISDVDNTYMDGQLNVAVGNDMTLRLYDEHEPQYVGRVHTSTRSYYWQSDSYHRDREAFDMQFNPSVEDSMRLIRAVTGKDVSRFDQKQYAHRKQSDVSAEFNSRTNANGASYSNYRFVDIVLDHPTMTREVNGEKVPYRYNLYSTPRGNSAKSISFITQQEAVDFLQTQIELARQAYTDSIQFEELSEAAKIVARAREVMVNRRYTVEQQKEARALHDDAMMQVEHLYDNRYSASQDALFKDLVAIEQYMAHPESGLIQLTSIPNEDVAKELESYIKTVANGVESSDEVFETLYRQFVETRVGSYENGFDPSIVSELGADEDRPRLMFAVEAAIKRSGYDQSKLIGNNMMVDRLRDRIIKFDPETARTLDEVLAEDPERKQYQTKAMLRVLDHLSVDNIENVEIQIDANGIINYAYDRPDIFTRGKKGVMQRMSNQIGQVFNEDEYGIIHTKFGGSQSFGFVPGYEAYFTPGDIAKIEAGLETDDERRARLRLRSYEQAIMAEIDRNMVEQKQAPYLGGRGDDRYDNFVDTMGASSLNKVYRNQLQGFKLEPDYVDRFLELRSEDELKANIRTLRNRVRFPNEYGTVSGTNFDDYVQQEGFNEAKLVGENLRVVDTKWDNIFDPYMLGSGKNQGVERYLVDGAVVQADGTVQASDGWDNPYTGKTERDRVAMTKQEAFKYIDYMPSDRQMMATKQALVAFQVTDPVGVAFMNFGGWTYDDGMVISKEYAEKYQVPVYEDENGAMRPQMKGDKQSDFGSNKGVANLVIDRNMSEEEARAQGIWKEVQFFKANPELDVVMGPYATLSRNNMSVLKMARDRQTIDLVDPLHGDVKPNAIGFMPMMVTDMTVDKKSHVYDKSDQAKGKGRSVSTLLLLNLQAMGAKGIINEVYGNNVTAWADLREYALIQGVDIDRDGNMKIGYHPQEGEERMHFRVSKDKSADDFMKEIANNGGILNLPFPLINKELDRQLLQDSNEERVRGHAVRALTRDENGEFGIPILSGALRRSVNMMRDEAVLHDVTDHYIEIYKRAAEYLETMDQLKDLRQNGASQKEIDDVRKRQAILYQDAQKKYDRIQATLAPKIDGPGANGKYSHIRDKITSKKMGNSATLVACADPRLKINQVAISKETAEKMGIVEGQKVLGWRDPTWRTGAVRSFEVVIDDSVQGFAMNPVMDKSHDGDFDGDAYGFIVVRSEEALKELETVMSHGHNILNYGDGQVEIDGKDYYPVFVNDGMDMASSSHAFKENGKDDPEELRKKATIMANDPSVSRDEVVDVLNEYVEKSLRSDENFATDYVDLTDSQMVMTSLAKIVNKKAKGKAGNLLECAKYEGVDLPGVVFDTVNPSEKINYVSADTYHEQNVEAISRLLEDVQKGQLMDVLNPDPVSTHATDKDRLAVQYATATKSDNTGRPGTMLQDATATFRNEALREAMEIFYKPTQMTLQIKHNAVQAYDINTQFSGNGNISCLFLQGLDPNTPEGTPRNERLLTKSQWIKAVDAELQSLGLDYNPTHLDVLGSALEGQNGIIRSLERAFNDEASYFNKLSFGGKVGGKDGGIQALVKGGIQEQCLFRDENDIDRAVVPNAIKNKSVVMARQDVLVQKQNTFEEIQERLVALEQDNERKLTFTPETVDVKPSEPIVSHSVVTEAPVKEADYELDL